MTHTIQVPHPSLPRPITVPTSAWEVLERVIKLLHMDHRMLRMGTWYKEQWGEEPYEKDPPRCGTVGCLSGWIGHIIGIDGVGGSRTSNAIGPTWQAARDLRYGFTGGDHFICEDGTPEQSRLAIKFLEGYMAKYETELKAHMVIPGRVSRSYSE